MKPAQILRELKKLPKKVLGQNFLADDKVVQDMIQVAEIKKEETVVEIGPGLGSLTFPLTKLAERVIAIEADYEFVHYLRLHKVKNLTIISGDALRIDWTIDIEGTYKVVANIPYSLTSPLLRKIYHLEARPIKVVLLIQKAMAERLVAEPGSSKRGMLTLLAEANASAKIIRTVKPGSFYPTPKVDSAIVSLQLLPKSQEADIFWPAVEAGFRHKRQMLINGLNKDLHLPKPALIRILELLSIDSKVRAEDLSFEQWANLSRVLSKK
jgi:16S rRNA (adenine1518-N6/adenine1519-N6)-dimethyltransferase